MARSQGEQTLIRMKTTEYVRVCVCSPKKGWVAK
jgi:hypothetical protein